LIAAKANEVPKIFTTPEVSDSATAVEDPPYPALPHTTTLPSVLSAAKADCVENTRTTPLLMLLATAEESPPPLVVPQVTTRPFVLTAANASWVAKTSTTPLVSSAFTAVDGAPPSVDEPQHATAPPAMMAAKAVCVDWMRITFATVAEVVVMLPPLPVAPHATTEPSFFKAANAY
jgi:hypothetical protein